MADVWLFGSFYCINILNSQDTKDHEKAKWRSQTKVPQGSTLQRNGSTMFIAFDGVLVSYPVYLTDLQYQLRDTAPKPDSLRPKYTNKATYGILTSSTYYWFERVGAIEEYQPYVNPNPSVPNNPSAFDKPVRTPKPLIDLGYLDFADERLELGYDYGAVGGMGFKTEIVEVANDREQRNALRYLPLGRWQLGDRSLLESDLEGIHEVEYLKAFHTRRLGSFQGFRFKDWSDYRAVDQLLGVGDDFKTQFQFRKTYAVGSATFHRPITKLVEGTVEIDDSLLSPLSYDVDLEKGLVIFDQPPPLATPIVASFEFDIPVWFESDQIGFRLEGYEPESKQGIYKLESVFVVEGRIPTSNWVNQNVPQILEPLDLGIIYETIEQYEFSTSKQELASGYVKRQANRIDSRAMVNLGDRKYDASETAKILSYFWLAKGSLGTFPFKILNQTYTARFATDQLSLKFDAASEDDKIFSMTGLKLQLLETLGLFKYLDADTYLYFVVDTSSSNPLLAYHPAIYEAFYEYQNFLNQTVHANGSKSDIFGFSDERWLTIPVQYPQPKVVYVIFQSEASPVYHSTITFTPATATFDSDVANYITAYQSMDFCKVIVITLGAPNSAYDIFNAQLFAATEGLLGYTPALEDYGVEATVVFDPDIEAAAWLDYFLTRAIAALSI